MNEKRERIGKRKKQNINLLRKVHNVIENSNHLMQYCKAIIIPFVTPFHTHTHTHIARSHTKKAFF